MKSLWNPFRRVSHCVPDLVDGKSGNHENEGRGCRGQDEDSRAALGTRCDQGPEGKIAEH